jgi:hypothetical protein
MVRSLPVSLHINMQSAVDAVWVENVLVVGDQVKEEQSKKRNDRFVYYDFLISTK